MGRSGISVGRLVGRTYDDKTPGSKSELFRSQESPENNSDGDDPPPLWQRGSIRNMERVMGIEPTSLPWQGSILPLNHTRGICPQQQQLFYIKNLPRPGLEPAGLAAYAPQAYASANSATWA